MPTYRLTIPVYVDADTEDDALALVLEGEGNYGPPAVDLTGPTSPSVTPAITESDAPVIVGSGFADSDTACPTCSREILTGWQAWVTAWDDLDRRAFHPDCAGPCRTCEAITGRDPVTGYCARCARD